MSSLDTLKLAAKIERKIAEIYRLFYDMFKEEKMAAHLWESLIDEEEAHAGFLDAKIRMLKVEPDTFGPAATEMTILEETVQRMEELESYVRNNPVDLPEAIDIALKIERELVEKRYNKLVEIADPSLKRIFADLTKSDGHVEKLVIAARQFGVKGGKVRASVE